LAAEAAAAAAVVVVVDAGLAETGFEHAYECPDAILSSATSVDHYCLQYWAGVMGKRPGYSYERARKARKSPMLSYFEALCYLSHYQGARKNGFDAMGMVLLHANGGAHEMLDEH
jgi:hypothetical protein